MLPVSIPAVRFASRSCAPPLLGLQFIQRTLSSTSNLDFYWDGCSMLIMQTLHGLIFQGIGH